MENGCGKIIFFYLILCHLDEDNFNDLGALIFYMTVSLLHNNRAYAKWSKNWLSDRFDMQLSTENHHRVGMHLERFQRD